MAIVAMLLDKTAMTRHNAVAFRNANMALAVVLQLDSNAFMTLSAAEVTLFAVTVNAAQ